ncbi:hypothetical protein FQR65_LT20721 [Abscondita terminalis]|nr:hypothetical protein FQR65_LT20721 [Abscondita terminalis]
MRNFLVAAVLACRLWVTPVTSSAAQRKNSAWPNGAPHRLRHPAGRPDEGARSAATAAASRPIPGVPGGGDEQASAPTLRLTAGLYARSCIARPMSAPVLKPRARQARTCVCYQAQNRTHPPPGAQGKDQRRTTVAAPSVFQEPYMQTQTMLTTGTQRTAWPEHWRPSGPDDGCVGFTNALNAARSTTIPGNAQEDAASPTESTGAGYAKKDHDTEKLASSCCSGTKPRPADLQCPVCLNSRQPLRSRRCCLDTPTQP